MGKKSLIEDSFDPLGQQLERDAERRRLREAAPALAPPPAPRAAPVAPVAPTAPEVRAPAPHLRPVEAPRPAKPRVERPAPPKEQRRTFVASPIGEESPRIKVSPGAFQDLRDVLDTVRRETGSKVTYSVATRAAWALLVRAQSQFVEAVKQNPIGKLPSTRDGIASAEYEERVLVAFATAIRRMPLSTLRAALLSGPRESEQDEAEN